MYLGTHKPRVPGVIASALPLHTDTDTLCRLEYSSNFSMYDCTITFPFLSPSMWNNPQCRKTLIMLDCLSFQSTPSVKLCPPQPQLPIKPDNIALIRSDTRHGEHPPTTHSLLAMHEIKLKSMVGAEEGGSFPRIYC